MQKNEKNPYNYQSFDEMLSSRIRLAALALLAGCDEAEFTYIRDVIQTTDGNLASHLKTLEGLGYIEVKKEFIERKPRTTYSRTCEGEQAFKEHLQALEAFIKQATD